MKSLRSRLASTATRRSFLVMVQSIFYEPMMDLFRWPTLELRPCTAEDEPLLREIYASTREEELMTTGWPPEMKTFFLRQQFDAQHRWYHTQYQGGEFDLILEGGKPVGRFYVYRQPTNLALLEISLLPLHRGRGLGTFLLSALLAEADRSQRTVSLYVESFNRAWSLYERLGFQQIEADGIYLQMRRDPQRT